MARWEQELLPKESKVTLRSSSPGGCGSECKIQSLPCLCGLERVHQATSQLCDAGSALKMPRRECAKRGRRTDCDSDNKENDQGNIVAAPKRRQLETLEALAVLDPFRNGASAAKVRLVSPVVTPHAAIVNFHIRDRSIQFEVEPHRYLLHPGTDMEAVFPISVSGLWARYFPKFDPELVIHERFAQWARNPKSPYYKVINFYRQEGETQTEIAKRIRDAWTEEGLVASAAGTIMHRNIELALGGQEYDGSSVEMATFHRYVKEWLESRHWSVYRLEWSIYCTNAMVAGQIDAIFICNGCYHMVDWKRCKKPLDECAGKQYPRFGSFPVQDRLDNTCNHYFLQQNLYAVILLRRYGIKLTSMWLCHIHPSFETYRMIRVPDMLDEAAIILDLYSESRSRDFPWELNTVASGALIS